jgi:hypothetical protein
MGKGQWQLVKKKDLCAYKEQFPGASQQNISNYFSHSPF